MRVLLADDHAVVREGLRLRLELQPDIEIVGEARDGETAVELAGRLRPDVVLMDIGMPGLDGVEATRAIRRSRPGVRVIGLSMFQEQERIQALQEAGAAKLPVQERPARRPDRGGARLRGDGRRASRRLATALKRRLRASRASRAVSAGRSLPFSLATPLREH